MPSFARLAAILATSVTVASCTSGGQSSAASHSTSQPSGAQLTQAQASAIFTRFLSAFQSAQRTRNLQAELRLVTGAEVPAVKRLLGVPLGPVVPQLTSVRSYVPKLASYPRWFIVTADAPSYRGKFLFLLVQARPNADWQEGTELYSFPGFAPVVPDLSGVALDARGYASIVPASDLTLATTPIALPARFSAYFNTAANNHGAPAPPAFSSALVRATRAAIRIAPRYGWQVSDRLRPASFPIYALRLTGGGAAVIYATYEAFAWKATSAHPVLKGPQSAIGIGAVPDPFTLRQLHITSAGLGTRIVLNLLDEHLAIEPTAHGTVTDYFAGKALFASQG